MRVRTGDEVLVTHAASVQFTWRPIRFRIVKIRPQRAHDEYVWIDGYELDRNGDAVERREIYVKPRGLTSGARRI